MRARTRTVIACVAALLGGATFAADSAAEKFGATQWPFKPVLTANNDPKLCARLLAIAEREYLSAAGTIDFGAAVLREMPKVEWTSIAETPRGGSLSRADLDLDGNGTKQTVVYRDNAFNWKGNWHYAYVFPTVAAFESAKARVVAEWSELPKDSQYPPVEGQYFGARQYFPSAHDPAGKSFGTGNVWGEHALFETAGHYYLVFSQNDFDRLQPTQLPVYRLRAAGHVERACVVSFNWQDTAHVKFSDLPAVESFVSIVRQIGNPGPDQGTLHTAVRHTAGATASETVVASRPWVAALHDGGSYFGLEQHEYTDLLDRFLIDWGNQEPWNHREIALLKMMRASAEHKYANYLQGEFGMSAKAANVGARRALVSLIGGWLSIPQGYAEDGAKYCFTVDPLSIAALNRDRATFDALLPKLAEPEYSRALFAALEWPYAVDALLALGADPNFKNESGKTSLMMAAHLDRIDTVRKLLKAGARVNEKMHGSHTYGVLMTTRINRTALMYAAENASPRVLELLLKAGEKADAKDSRGNGIGFYLSNNPRFAKEEWRGGIEGVLKGISGKIEPSFDCRDATTRIEKTICGSEALAIFDREIAAAFERFRQREGSAALAEQRAWLKERNLTCSSALDESCVGDLMRTRMRYLHARLGE